MMILPVARAFPPKVHSIAGSRSIVTFIKNILGFDPPPRPDEPTIANRFHPWDSSPSTDLRMRAAWIRANAKCAVTGKEINYTCPLSGIPTHHSREAWEADTEYHEKKKYELLKLANVYEHDLRSGRAFPEFNFATDQTKDAALNFANWDTFFFTRSFFSMDSIFNMAHVTKILSYPLTIGSVLHKYSPYLLKPKGPVTLEGLKSIAALRYTMYPELGSTIRDRPMRMFIVGARAESQLPGHVWKQLCYLFPDVDFEIHFIGPESNYNKDKHQYEMSSRPIAKRFDYDLKLVTHTDFFHTYHEAGDFFPYDPYLDCFFVFHPGFGATEALNANWKTTVEGLIETKCPVFVTGYSDVETTKDYEWVEENFGDKIDHIFDKSENIFGSSKWEVNDMEPREVYQLNQHLFGFRGKRYHAVKK